MFSRTYWDPVREIERLQDEVNRLFTGFNGAVHEFPPLNVWADENDVIVTAELPGVRPEDLDISVKGQSLTLRGERKAEELKQGEAYHRQERIHGPFTRTIELPFRVDNDKVEAAYSKGILRIKLQRAEADKPKKVHIHSA